MPLYEYRCQKCDQKFEWLVRTANAAAEEIECPKCQGTQVERLVSVAARPRGNASSLPIARPSEEGCGMPRCCGGGCQM